MNDSPKFGPGSKIGTFEVWGLVAPPADLEKSLAASLYLAETGFEMAGPLEDLAVRLVAELARTRQALQEQYDIFSVENKKLRARYEFERHISNDMMEENAELEEKVKLLEFESQENFKAWETAQTRLENAIEISSELASSIDWDALLDD